MGTFKNSKKTIRHTKIKFKNYKMVNCSTKLNYCGPYGNCQHKSDIYECVCTHPFMTGERCEVVDFSFFKGEWFKTIVNTGNALAPTENSENSSAISQNSLLMGIVIGVLLTIIISTLAILMYKTMTKNSKPKETKSHFQNRMRSTPSHFYAQTPSASLENLLNHKSTDNRATVISLNKDLKFHKS